MSKITEISPLPEDLEKMLIKRLERDLIPDTVKYRGVLVNKLALKSNKEFVDEIIDFVEKKNEP